jgi:hypothetical protein
MRGVTRKRSSDSSFWKFVLRNKAPKMGISPSSGIFDTCWRTAVLTRPAKAKLSPSLSSREVEARLVRSSGTVKPA